MEAVAGEGGLKITPKNWSSFQHYKDRSPAWIKLHKKLLDDYAFFCLPLASRALAPCLWLLASEYIGGEIDASEAEIAFRLHMTVDELSQAITPLIDGGFFVASGMLAECKQDAIPEKRRERDREEEDNAPSARHQYVFESGVIRLTDKNFNQWRDAFSHLDLKAELIGLTEWAGQQKNWFMAVSGALSKRNRELGVRIAQSAVRPALLTPSGNPWPEGIV